MDQNKFAVESGLVHLSLVREDGSETGRSIDFNPADIGFAEDLYGLISKLDAIHMESVRKVGQVSDAASLFDINRAEEKEMRAAVDGLFGEGFCADVFGTVRLFALVNGLTVIENLLLALFDQMEESVAANISVRDARVKKYTEKYNKHRT